MTSIAYVTGWTFNQMREMSTEEIGAMVDKIDKIKREEAKANG